MIRKQLKAFAVATLLAGMTTVASGQTNIRLGHVLGPEHSWNQAALGFAKDVAEGTDGRVQIEVFHSGQLGGEQEMVQGFTLGTTEAAIIGCGSFQSMEPSFAVVEAPYHWPDRESAYRALDGELGDALSAKLAEKGVVNLAYWENGFRHVTNNRGPIETPEDLKGLKIRVTPDPIRLDAFEALGAEPAPLAFGELYSALQQGVFDAQENPAEIIYNYSLYEVQDYLSLTHHVYGAACLVMAKPVFESLRAQDRETVREAAITWRDKQRTMAAKATEAALKKLEEVGMKINEVDIEPFVEAVQPVWEKYRDVFGEDIVEIVESYR